MWRRKGVYLQKMFLVLLMLSMLCSNLAGFAGLEVHAETLNDAGETKSDDAEGETYFYVYKNGVKVAEGAYVDPQGNTIRVMDSEDGESTYDGDFDGYVRTTSSGGSITLIPYAAEGYEFAILNLTDAEGLVCTPLSRDYVKTPDGADTNQLCEGESETGYTFTVDPEREAAFGLSYPEMPEIAAYFDPKDGLLNDTLKDLASEDSDGNIVESWLSGSIHAGANAWNGKDVKAGQNAVFYAGDDEVFQISSAIIYGRYNWSDSRNRAKIEGSMDGRNWSAITETANCPNTAKRSTARQVMKTGGVYKYLRLSAVDNITNISLMKIYGERKNKDDVDWSGMELPEFINTEGTALKHPAVSSSGENLLRVREHILNGDAPWYEYYQNFACSTYASKGYSIRNDAEPGSDTLTPKYSYGSYNTGLFNNEMTADATAAYYQSLMYFFTGDNDYREKAMRILRLWSILDPEEATFVVDAHIHMGPPTYLFTSAAELLRYTSTSEEELVWTEEDSQNYITNFLTPAVNLWFDNNTYYLNQHQTALQASMSAYIFEDNKEKYEERVEWFTVNSTNESSDNGALRNALPEFTAADGSTWVTIREMQRDQGHASLSISMPVTMANMLNAQETKVDPVSGTPSDDSTAVGIYEFLDDRILRAANTFYAYNMGYDVPCAEELFQSYGDTGRGRIDYHDNFSQVYYYYKYARGYKDTDPEMKYLAEAMQHRYDVYGAIYGDIFVYIPEEAAGTAVPQPVDTEGAATSSGPFQIDSRYTAFDDNSEIKTEDGTRYLEVKAGTEGSAFTIFGIDRDAMRRKLALRIRTNGVTTVGVCRNSTTEPFKWLNLPDTKGEWRYVVFSVSDVSAGDYPEDCSMLHFIVKGDPDVKLDLDYMKAGDDQITPPEFEDGMKEITLTAFRGAEFSYGLQASDSNSAHTVLYSLGGKQESGMQIDDDGTFRWQLADDIKSGVYSVYVDASDGEAVTTLKVNIEVYDDYMTAVEKVTDGLGDETLYESEGYAIYEETYSAAVKLKDSSDLQQQNIALQNLVKAVKALRLVNPKMSDGSLDYTEGRVSSGFSMDINNLCDNDGSTHTGDIWGSDDKSFIWDFGFGYRVTVSEISILPRDGFADRAEGVVVFGSENGKDWAALTGLSAASAEWQSLIVSGEYRDTPFRYLKFKDVNGGVLNREETTEDQPLCIAEVRIMGDRQESIHKISDVKLESESGKYTAERDGNTYVSYRAVKGDDVTLSFTSKEELQDVKVTICGTETEFSVEQKNGEYQYRAVYTVSESSASAMAEITIDYVCADGVTRGNTVCETTDGSKVLVSNESNLIGEIFDKADISVADKNWNVNQMEKLFDDDYATFTETLVDGSGNGAYYMFDFGKAGEDYAVMLDRVELLDRVNWTDRIKGTCIQGSNDGETWITISENSAVGTNDWQKLKISDQYQKQKFRYIRVYNGNSWFGNLSEIRFYGEYGTGLPEAEVETFTVSAKPSAEEAGTVIVYYNKTGSCPASEPEGNVSVLENIEYGTSVAAEAVPAEGYRFVKWTQSKVVDGIEVDYILSYYPRYTVCQYSGGYLGGTKTYAVTEDMELVAWFEKIEDEDPGQDPENPGDKPDDGSGQPDDGESSQPDDGGSSQPDDGESGQPDNGGSGQPDNGGSSQPDKNADAGSEGSPETGDETLFVFWLGILLLTAGTGAAAGYVLKKRR